MTYPRIKPESSEYRELLRTLAAAPSEVAPIVTAAVLEAAEMLVRETGQTLYRIDLAAIISKYIGETERNLDGLSDEVPAGTALIVERVEITESIRSLIQRLGERAALIVIVTDEPDRLQEALPAPPVAHIAAAAEQ